MTDSYFPLIHIYIRWKIDEGSSLYTNENIERFVPKKKFGIFLWVLGFGWGMYDDYKKNYIFAVALG